MTPVPVGRKERNPESRRALDEDPPPSSFPQQGEETAVASSKRTARTARKKYVPSAEQRADDERLRRELANADMKKFDAIFRKPDRKSVV